MFRISNVKGYWILDSRGNPTIQCEVTIEKNDVYYTGVAGVPSGASTGSHEALELRDGDKAFGGKGVDKAVGYINGLIRSTLVGSTFEHADQIDEVIIREDGTENKSRFGANAILGVSLATHKAFSKGHSVPYHDYLHTLYFAHLDKREHFPRLLSNVINGGAHANNGLSIQEFMIVPRTGNLLTDVQCSVEVYQTLKKELASRNLSTGLGDEGGFAPTLGGTIEALELLHTAVEKAGYTGLVDYALDCAATEFYNKDNDTYTIDGQNMSKQQLLDMYKDITNKYGIISIEDGFSEDDLEGWKMMTDELGNTINLVGDDLFVTNSKRFVAIGLDQDIANTVLIKLNQIGSVKETCDIINLAKKHNYKTIVSHRSGETSDTFMSDLCVASQSEFIKLGAPARGERVAKYNRLIQIKQNA